MPDPDEVEETTDVIVPLLGGGLPLDFVGTIEDTGDKLMDEIDMINSCDEVVDRSSSVVT